MIVSCPSCDSKYQVADDKVAGSMLRTRCKACGAQIVVDGTVPPPTGDGKTEATEDDVARNERPGDHPGVGNSAPPANSSSKPPPPKRMSTNAGLAPANSKPPPPMRRTQSGSLVAVSDKPSANEGVSKKPVVDVTSADALDPSASANDFYSKLLSKVGSPKTTSQPAPSGPVEPFSPRKTYPPPREPFAMATDRMPSHPAPGRSDAPHSGPSPQLNSDAPPGDFYARILAKVKPQKSDEAPAPQSHSDGEQPPGAQVHPATSRSAAPAPPMKNSTSPGIVTAPIRVVQPAPLASSARFSPRATTLGLGEIDVHVELPGEDAPAEAQPPQSATSAAVGLPSPVAPQRSEPPLAPSIQLPPLSAPPPSAGAVAIARNSAVPAQAVAVAPKTDSTPEPSVKASTSRSVQPSSIDPYGAQPKQNKRFAVMLVAIIGVGLLGVGGGVAVTFYALKPSINAATQPSMAVPVAAAVVTSIATAQQQPLQQAAAAPMQAAPAQSQTAASVEPTKPASAEHEKSASAKNVRGAAAAAPAMHAATPVAAAPAAPAVAVESRTTAKASGPSDSNIPAWLDQKAGAKPPTTKTPALPAANPTPAKAGGSGPFPKDVAMAMLGVAASQAPSCKKPGGPTGTGKAIVTFDVDGSVVITNIVGEGFSGSPTGQCVASLFRRVRVPPFGGDRATATKIFTIPQ